MHNTLMENNKTDIHNNLIDYNKTLTKIYNQREKT